MRLAPLALLLLLANCSAAKEKPAKSAPTAGAKQRAAKPKAAPKKPLYPRRCASPKGDCVPPQEWVKKLCDDIYPDLALHLFSARTPWRRLYMTARAEPFNASGGMSLMGDRMEPGEEVIALRRRDEGGLQMNDTAGWDVLRWNGACATIHDGDFTDNEPGTVRGAPIDWRRLSLEMRLALEADADVGAIYEIRGQKCKGKSVGKVSDECEDYDKRLRSIVVTRVREGIKLPKPAKVPEF